MTKQKLTKAIQFQEYICNGEIVSMDKHGIVYYDSRLNSTHLYRFLETCQKELIPKITYIGKNAKKLGITKEFITDILCRTYGDDLPEALQTLNSIVVFNGKQDFIRRLSFADERNQDEEMEEWVYYSDFRNIPSITYQNEGTVFINAKYLAEHAYGLPDFKKNLCAELIRQTRVEMLYTNLFLPCEKYPLEILNKDSAIDAFVENAMQRIKTEKRISSKQRNLENITITYAKEHKESSGIEDFDLEI